MANMNRDQKSGQQQPGGRDDQESGQPLQLDEDQMDKSGKQGTGTVPQQKPGQQGGQQQGGQHQGEQHQGGHQQGGRQGGQQGSEQHR
jgi:hypothetical protein